MLFTESEVHLFVASATHRWPRDPAPRTRVDFLFGKGLVCPPSVFCAMVHIKKGPVCPPSVYRQTLLHKPRLNEHFTWRKGEPYPCNRVSTPF